jgi:hypothetical protein
MNNILDLNGNDFSIENNHLVHNKNIYKIDIDYGNITLGSTRFIIIMENSHISLINQDTNMETNYFFKDCLFYMNYNIINIQRLVYNVSDCNFEITRGRILINYDYYEFTMVNNKIHILNCTILINNTFINNINEDNTNVKNILLDTNTNHVNNTLLDTNHVNNIKSGDKKKSVLLEFTEDPQNVHRTDLLSHLVNKFILLEKRCTTIPHKKINPYLIINEIDTYIETLAKKISYYNKFLYLCNYKKNSNKSLFDFDIIYDVLYIISKTNGFIYRFNNHELYILTVVWINCTTDDLKNILLENLKDMYLPHAGTTYCLTGRVSRMINTFEGILFNENKIDISTIRSEILNKCSIIRNNNLDISIKELQQIIKDTMYKDYVLSNILSQDDLDNELNSWIDYI